MTWEDLNEDNITQAKELYIEYIEENKDTMYRANMMTFEEFISHIHKCQRCDNLIDEDERYCMCCHDDLFM